MQRTDFQVASSSIAIRIPKWNINTTARAGVEVNALRRYIEEADLEELAFATSDDGDTWVMIIRPNEDHLDLVRNLLSTVWLTVGFRRGGRFL